MVCLLPGCIWPALFKLDCHRITTQFILPASCCCWFKLHEYCRILTGLARLHITVNKNYEAECKAAKILIIKCLDPTVRITKSCLWAELDDCLQVQNNPLCTSIDSKCVLCGEMEYGGKGSRNFHAVTWKSVSRRAWRAAMQNNSSTTTNVSERIWSTI